MNKIKLSALFLAFIGLMSCKSTQPTQTAKTGMYKISILYPNGAGKTFDMDYYEKNHMPMVAGMLGKNLKFYEIDKGIAGRTPTDEIPFLAMGHFYCYNIAEYNNAIAQNRDKIINDFKNYTNIQPIVQVSQIKELR